MTFSYLRSKEAIIELFGGIIEKVATRPGGYTRIIKTGFRLGDNAEMCIIELVDYNELMLKDSKPAKKTTRRSRRGTGTAVSVAVATETDTDVVTNGEGIAEEPSAPEASEDSTKEETDNK